MEMGRRDDWGVFPAAHVTQETAMSQLEFETALQDLMTAFHCTHEQAEQLARYFLSTEQTALRETSVERGYDY
jgi:hypothetical protein